MTPPTPQHKASKCDSPICADCARSEARTFALGTVPIITAHQSKLIEPPDYLPYLYLDASNRPDLQDLARVNLEIPDDERAVGYSWEYLAMPGAPAHLARLDVIVTRPVRTSYKILFDLDKHYGLLLVLCCTGKLVYNFAPSNSPGTFMLSNMEGLDYLYDRVLDADEMNQEAEAN